MRHVITLLVACIAMFHSAHAHAQAPTVLVRAGEHRDYTRLLLQLPEQNHWRLRTGIISARLDIDGPPLVFDLAQTFARIPRTRLRDVRASEGGLDLYIGCDCNIQAHEDIPQFLIIDIIGTGSHTAFAPMTAPRPPRRPLHMMADRKGRAADPRRAGTQLAQALRGGVSDMALPHALTLSEVFGDAPSMPRQAISDATANGPSQRAAVARELGLVLASSVSSGNLQAATEFTASTDPETAREDKPLRSENDLGAHFSVAAQGRTQSTTSAAPALPCPDVSFHDPSEWFAQTDPADISQNLGNLFNEFDQAEPHYIRESAQHFILLGFGAEARMVLSLLADPDEAADILTSISYLVDMSELPATLDLSPLAACGPMGSLWAFLASGDKTLPAAFSIDNLVHALQDLPPHLRLHLGPKIVQRLAKSGRLEEAQVIFTSLDRVAQPNSGQLNLARAALDLPRAQSDKAHMLEKSLSPETSDDDLIFLLSRREVQGKPVEASLLEAATTRLFALRGTRPGREIARLVVRAMARMAEFQQAFHMLDGRDAALSQEAAEPLRIELLTGLVAQADDTDFITLMFEQRPWEMPYLPDALVAQLVSRLRSLGFDIQADLLKRSAESSRKREATDRQATRDILPSGQEASGVHFHDQASVAPPSEVAEDQANILRARAAQARARNESINPGQNAPAPEQPAATADVMASESQEMTESDQRGQAPAADTSRTHVPEEPGTALLARSRDALGQSTQLRARLRTLLDGGEGR